MLTVTERRVRSDVSESHQEEVKKPEEQASVVTQTAEFPESASTTVDSPRGKLRSMCARMTTRQKCEVRWRHYQEGDELAREQFRRFGRKLVRRPSVFSKYVDAQHRSTYPYIRSRSSVPKCRESFTIKSACSNIKWRTEYQTLRWSLKDSGHRKGLQNV